MFEIGDEGIRGAEEGVFGGCWVVVVVVVICGCGRVGVHIMVAIEWYNSVRVEVVDYGGWFAQLLVVLKFC